MPTFEGHNAYLLIGIESFRLHKRPGAWVWNHTVLRPGYEQAGSILVLDAQGRPSAIVNEAAVLATPEDRRPWLPVSAVARTVEPGLTFPADLSGEPLILAMQKVPATEYLLVDDDGAVYGVLVTADVDKAFAAGV